MFKIIKFDNGYKLILGNGDYMISTGSISELRSFICEEFDKALMNVNNK